jgi:hypothetical protein
MKNFTIFRDITQNEQRISNCAGTLPGVEGRAVRWERRGRPQGLRRRHNPAISGAIPESPAAEEPSRETDDWRTGGGGPLRNPHLLTRAVVRRELGAARTDSGGGRLRGRGALERETSPTVLGDRHSTSYSIGRQTPYGIQPCLTTSAFQSKNEQPNYSTNRSSMVSRGTIRFAGSPATVSRRPSRPFRPFIGKCGRCTTDPYGRRQTTSTT